MIATADPTLLHPAPVHEEGALDCGPRTLKLTDPPGEGELVAPARVAEGVRAVATTTLDVAATLRVGSACTMTPVDLALAVPTQFVPMVGRSVYCHVPEPGTSVQVTTDEAMAQLPLMGTDVPEPEAYLSTVYAVSGVPPLVELCVKVTVTV